MKEPLSAEILLKKLRQENLTEEEWEVLKAWYLTWSVDEPLDLSDEQLRESVLQMDQSIPYLTYRRTVLKLHPVIIAAASLLIFIFLGVIWYSLNHKELKPDAVNYASLIKHGSNGATLTLSNGKKIALNGSLKGQLAVEAGVSITKTRQGMLLYHVKNTTPSNSGEMNTLATARGEQYQIQLPDGTNVWLNAASSLKYPASFSGSKDRHVELNGEGYFEIAADRAHPFIVYTQNQHVEVLGTHFNISSYSDDPATQTTLVEGLVKINGRILKPNQQATLINGDVTIKDVDPEAAVAWKSGLFIFNNETLESLMRKVSRWYDIKVVYLEAADKNYLYGGSVSRFDNIESLLKKLQAAGNMNYRIEGKTVYIGK